MAKKSKLFLREETIEMINTEINKVIKESSDTSTLFSSALVNIASNIISNAIKKENNTTNVFKILSSALMITLYKTRNNVAKTRKIFLYYIIPLVAIYNAYSDSRIFLSQEEKNKSINIYDIVKEFMKFTAISLLLSILVKMTNRLTSSSISLSFLNNSISRITDPVEFNTNFNNYKTFSELCINVYYLSYIVSLIIMYIYCNIKRKNNNTISPVEFSSRTLLKSRIILQLSSYMKIDIKNIIVKNFKEYLSNDKKPNDDLIKHIQDITEKILTSPKHSIVKEEPVDSVKKQELNSYIKNKYISTINKKIYDITNDFDLKYIYSLSVSYYEKDNPFLHEFFDKISESITNIRKKIFELYSSNVFDSIVKEVLIFTKISNKTDIEMSFITKQGTIVVAISINENDVLELNKIVNYVEAIIAHEFAHVFLQHDSPIESFANTFGLTPYYSVIRDTSFIYILSAVYYMFMIDLKQHELEADALATHIVGSKMIDLLDYLKKFKLTRISDHPIAERRYDAILNYYKNNISKLS